MTGIRSNNDYIEKHNDIKLIEFIWVFYFIQTINAVIKNIFNINGYLWSLLSNMFMIIILIYLIRIIKLILKRNLRSFVLSEVLVLILFAISMLMGNAKIDILLNFLFWSACVGIPLGITYYSIGDKQLFIKYSRKYSILIIIAGIIGFLFMNEENSYIMSIAYFMLLPIITLINIQFKENTFRLLLLVVISISFILIYGARGPIIGIIYILMINFYKLLKKLTIKSFLLFVLIIMILVYALVFWNQMIWAIVDFLDEINVYSRTLTRLAYGGILDSSGRDFLFQYYIDLILERPIFGWGIAGEWFSRALGPHNAILELNLAFGVVIGGIISFMLILSFVLPFINRKLLYNDIYTSFAAVNLPLIVSAGDIWAKYNLFIYVFIILDIVNHSKSEKDRLIVKRNK